MEDKKLFACAECGKFFSRESLLEIHSLIHINEKESWHECKTCGKKFVHQAGLTVHMTTHVAISKYSCLECGKCFTSNSGLQHHTVVHTGVKEFSCPICPRKFYRKKDLKLHTTRVHQPKEVHRCEVCGKSFKLKSHLIHHALTKSCHKAAHPGCSSETQQPATSNMLPGKNVGTLPMDNQQQKSFVPSSAVLLSETPTIVATNDTLVVENTGVTPITSETPIVTTSTASTLYFSQMSIANTGAAPIANAGEIPIVKIGEAPNAGTMPITSGAPNAGAMPITSGAPNTGAMPITSEAPNAGAMPITSGAPNAGAMPITSGAPMFYTSQIPVANPDVTPISNVGEIPLSNTGVMPILYVGEPVRVTASAEFPCPSCGQNFQYKYLLRKHEKTHRDGNSTKHMHECGECERLFTNKAGLDTHYAKVHLNKFQFTTQRPRLIAPKINLSQMQETHFFSFAMTSGKSFPPTTTTNVVHRDDASVSDQQDLLQHGKKEQQNMESPRMKCFICGDEPGCKSNLVDEFRSQLTKMRYLCPECDGTLESSANLKDYFENTSLLMLYW